MLLMARALPPAARHHEVSGRKGCAGSGGARRAGQAGLWYQPQPAQLEGTEGCHTQSQGSQVLAFTSAKAQWRFQARKKGEIPTLQGKQELGSPPWESGVRGRQKLLSSAVWPIAGEGPAWRSGCSLQACIPAKSAINLCCWHANQVLLHCLYSFCLCVPALDPAFALSPAVTAQSWH